MSTEPDRGASDLRGIDALDHILQQLEDLIKVVKEYESKEVKVKFSFVEVHKKLTDVRKNIDRFNEERKRGLAVFGLKPQDMKPTPEEIGRLGSRERKILERFSKLQALCEEGRGNAYAVLQQNRAAVKQVMDELNDKHKKSLRRKSKFKTVGGKKGWMPT